MPVDNSWPRRLHPHPMTTESDLVLCTAKGMPHVLSQLLESVCEEHLYWILSALRGPDSTDSIAGLVKFIFTQRLRTWFAIPAPQRVRDLEEQDFGQVAEVLVGKKPPWWTHWYNHTMDALNASTCIPELQQEAMALIYLLRVLGDGHHTRQPGVPDTLIHSAAGHFAQYESLLKRRK